MKTLKHLKGWAITLMIFITLFIALSIVCVIRPAGFGEWLVLTYEDLTCELGHTPTEMFDKLLIISLSCIAVFFIINQILFLVYDSKLQKTKEIKVEKVERIIQIKAPKIKDNEITKKIKNKVKEKIEEKLESNNISTIGSKPLTKDQEMKNFLDSLRK